MKANELRIGNWYLSTKFQVPVICEMGDFYEIYARADGSSEYTVDDIFEPIPLTEEWLLKFGFRNECGYNCAVCYTLDFNSGLTINFLNKELYCYLNSIRLDNIKYVHQLQNLYFALTGNELTIEK